MPIIPTRAIPLWQTTDNETIKLFHGNALNVLERMPGNAIQVLITSPPYFGLRDYGTGDSNELGSEKTPEEYVSKMVAIFREAKRVLRNDGTVWLNLGDTYSGSGGTTGGYSNKSTLVGYTGEHTKGREMSRNQQSAHKTSVDLESGNLVGIPWRVALALQADGWILRSDIIWHKPNPMPESVQNRCTKAHEYLFMFSKRSNYYYDNEAVKDILEKPPHKPGNKKLDNSRNDHDSMQTVWGDEAGKNKRSVWSIEDEQQLVQWLAINEPDTLERFLKESTNKADVWKIATQGYPGAHFATFPPKLIEPCIKAGTSEHGCCANCGDPYLRITERKGARVQNTEAKRDRSVGNRNGKGDSTLDGERPEIETIGWERQCRCDTTEVVPCVVLDPFMGAATTAIVSLGLGRRVWGIELSKKYILCNQIPRIEGELRSRPALEYLIPERK